CRFLATKLTVRIAVSRETELQRQNERLELLLNLTTRITSSLNLREVLRAIAANIREVIHADAVPGELVRCQGSAQCHIVTEAKQQFANHRVFPELVVCLDCRPQNFLCRKLNCANLRKSMPLKFGCLILGPRRRNYSLSGTLACIFVPRFGCESIENAPFISFSRSLILVRPKPFPFTDTLWSKPTPGSLTMRWIAPGVPNSNFKLPLPAMLRRVVQRFLQHSEQR